MRGTWSGDRKAGGLETSEMTAVHKKKKNSLAEQRGERVLVGLGGQSGEEEHAIRRCVVVGRGGLGASNEWMEEGDNERGQTRDVIE